MNDILTLANLSKHPEINHAISTQAFGSMKKDDMSIHHANVLKFAKTANINTTVICMDQVHGGKAMPVENDRELVVPQTDGIVTTTKYIALGVITADCMPILLYDPVNKAIGAAHAGSKGLLKNIIGNTIKQMSMQYGSKPQDLIVGIGPSIEQKCYVVGKELIDLYKTAFSHYNSVYIEGNGTYFLDLRSVAVQDLRHEGVLKENIEVSQLCTKCHSKQLYSYRAGDKKGRFISIIGLS